MVNINRIPDEIKITVENGQTSDAEISFDLQGNMNMVTLKATDSEPKFIQLRWKEKTEGEVRVLGDAWERAYGNLEWKGLDPERAMPWYFLAKQENCVRGYGVMTLPNALASWEYDDRGITLLLDVRCGGKGVRLAGRTLDVCTIVNVAYYDLDAYDAATLFCKFMSPLPLLPEKPLYGGNNWYYAYGNSSYEEIVSDASLQAKLAEGLENRPFMVIDDGWQINPCAGPWEPNERYKDMKKTADAFKAMNVRPGIWVRYLRDERAEIPESWRLNKRGFASGSEEIRKCYLDPSVPEVIEFIKADTRKIVNEWGYELIKHDFSSVDIFGRWGSERGMLFTEDGWSFADRGRTSAEIVKDFYKAILDATGGKALVLGCNVIGHLAAGLVHANRTGDDTSGNDWERTRKMGVNTLIFRSVQHNAFFAADADCVGVIPGKIDMKLNLQWAKLLAYSGSPFFISCADGSLTEEEFAEMKKYYEVASKGCANEKPLDWEYNKFPSEFIINGEREEFDWYL